MYLHERYAPISLPVKQLRGFERITLNPGEKKSVTFTITPQDMMLLDRDMRWRVTPGNFDVMIGSSSEDIALRGSYEVRAGDSSIDLGPSAPPDLAK